jgi:outer membrane protein TolC
MYFVEWGEAKTKPAKQRSVSSLNLQEAIDYALVHSILIRQAKITVALAELDLKDSSGFKKFLPNLNLHHGYNPVSGENRIGFTMSFDIDKLLKGSSQPKRSKLKLFDANVYYESINRQVITTVTKSYFDMIIAQERVKLLEEQLNRDIKIRMITQIKFESGLVELGDLFRIGTVISNHRLDLLQAQAQVKIAELQFADDIGYKRMAQTLE